MNFGPILFIMPEKLLFESKEYLVNSLFSVAYANEIISLIVEFLIGLVLNLSFQWELICKKYLVNWDKAYFVVKASSCNFLVQEV